MTRSRNPASTAAPVETAAHHRPLVAFWLLAATLGPAATADTVQPLTIDHYVAHRSTVPAIEGQHVQLYLRERVLPAVVARGAALENRVVLFVHGAGTPAEVAFDVPYEDYSWMAYLATAGYDVFSVDITGYGRSTRPHVMNDSCNLSREDQIALRLRAEACAPSYDRPATTIASDWDDIDRAVEHIRALRGVDRVALFGWSLGGPRAGGYAARHPDKVSKLVLLAPAYSRSSPSSEPAATPGGAAITSQSRATFDANWRRQVGCESQYDAAVADSVWSEMIASDPVGATWGPGIRRAPRTLVWGWDEQTVGRQRTPALLIAAVHDGQVAAERVRELFDDYGAEQKVLIDLGCASHNAMWERVHDLMFAASLEWLESTTVDGMSQGIVRLGY